MGRSMSDPEKRVPTSGPSAFATEVQDAREGEQSAALSAALAGERNPEAPRIEGYLATVPLGEGAYGRVWRSWQLRTRKEVALKVFMRRTGLDWIFLRREVERLTRLDKHAHIVTLLDANLDSEPPFYAMDLVEAGSLARFADTANRVDAKTALKWMRQLCDALGYVHTKGIIHCDLKPANILVDEDDHVRVVDFGHSRVFTETIGSVGTLFFMAPEQAVLAEQGQPVQPDLRWDIYALGATIYNVLTGVPPYATSALIGRLEGASALGERLDLYRNAAVAGAATLVAPPGIDAEFWAVLRRCLEIDPARRYPTTRDVEADLLALEQCRPVSPLAHQTGYRVRKFVQRNPVPVLLASALGVALVASGITVTNLLRKEAAQRKVAENQRDRALLAEAESETVTKFLSDMIGSVDPSEAMGQEVTVREVLDRAALQAEAGFAAQPLVEATLRETIGRTYRALGQPDAAEKQLRRVLELRTRNLPAADPDIASAKLEMCRLLGDRGKYAEAESVGREVLDRFREHFGESHQKVADALVALAHLRHDQGDFVQAELLFRQAMEIVRKLKGDEHPDLASILSELAPVLVDENKLEEAESVVRDALSIRTRVLGSRHPQVAESFDALGTVLQYRGRIAAAEPFYLQALEIRRVIYPAEHPLIAQTLNNYAAVLERRGLIDAAEPLFREALAINRKVRGGNNPDVATSLNNLGVFLFGNGKIDEAEPLLKEAISIQERTFGPDSSNVASPAMTLGRIYHARGDFAQAEPLLRRAAMLARKDVGEDHPQVAVADGSLGAMLIARGEREEGEGLLRRAIAVLKSPASGGAFYAALYEGSLGVSLTEQEKFDEAEVMLQSSLAVLRDSLGMQDRNTKKAAAELVRLYERMGRSDDAVQISDLYLSTSEATAEDAE